MGACKLFEMKRERVRRNGRQGGMVGSKCKCNEN